MDLLVGLTIASLAILSVLFLAHLGAHSHSDECHACEVLGHSIALTPAAREFVRPHAVNVPVFRAAVEPLATAASTPGGPRAPPVS